MRIAEAADPILEADGESYDRPIRFLYVGQLIERKGPLELLDAFARLPRGLATLSILGYGPLEGAVRDKIVNMQLDNVVSLPPTTTVYETALEYARHDVLVMPSLREVWGLVVNEALAAGAYVLSSRYAGVTPDLVSNSPIEVGRVITPDDPDEFARNLEDTALMIRAQGLNRAAIAAWGRSHSPERLANAMVEAIGIAMTRKPTGHQRFSKPRLLRSAH